MFGVLAAVVGVVDTVPYVRDMLRGATRPHRGTWLIWGVLAIVVCLSQRADGASWSLVMAGAQAVLTSVIFVLAIRMGEGGLSASDGVLIAIAGGGVAGWMLAQEPIVATACIIAADLIAAAMMVPKVYRDPGSETLVTFALASGGGALAAGAVGMVDALAARLPGLLLPGQRGRSRCFIHRRRAVLGGAPGPDAQSASSHRLTRIAAPSCSSTASPISAKPAFSRTRPLAGRSSGVLATMRAIAGTSRARSTSARTASVAWPRPQHEGTSA